MTHPDSFEKRKKLKSLLVGGGTFLIALIATFILGILAASVFERRQEAALPISMPAGVTQYTGDSARWGEAFPREYESWLATAESEWRSKYGGSSPIDHLALDPKLKQLFAGYPFAIEYNDDRGHLHALEDVRNTARIDPARGGKAQPGTCMTCKSSDVPGLMKKLGAANFYRADFTEISKEVRHPIGCADCHDAKTMQLRISRPALREAYQSMGKDIEKATHQEMRSLVCAQCHVEYYFAKKSPEEKRGSYLTFPWKNGTNADDMDNYYSKDVKHVDWVHPESGTEMVKMQHPDYELFTSGPHAARGVACADCHMPYRNEGGVKYSSHHLRSPLQDVNEACGVCHHIAEKELVAQVERVQDTTRELLDRAEIALAAAHKEVGAAKKAGASDEQLKTARTLLRRAQLRWDYIAAGNGMGFHAPQESARVLASSIDLAQQARISVAKYR